MKQCEGCRFCCWSFGVKELEKGALVHCQHECEKGCDVHDTEEFPKSCGQLICPYLQLEGMHRPDNFQSVLEELKGNLGAYIPCVPLGIPVEEANGLIRKTNTVLASIQNVNGDNCQWAFTVIPLNRMEDGSWITGTVLYMPWMELCQKYGAEFKAPVLYPWFTIIQA